MKVVISPLKFYVNQTLDLMLNNPKNNSNHTMNLK